MELRNNTILITGGTGGIGLELATQLLNLDNTVIVTGRNQSKLNQVKKELPKLYTFQSDVSNPTEIKSLFENVTKQFPDLNILINNAGIMRKLNLHDESLDLENINQEIAIDLSGPVRMVQQFLRHLKTKQSAAIVNVSSGLAFVPYPISPIYCATKAGIHSYTQSLRVQLKNTNIRVFELAPPSTNTDLNNVFTTEELKGLPMMPTPKMVKAVIKGLINNTLEIRPGASNLLKIMSRLAPKLILKIVSKPVDSLLAQSVSVTTN